jgi:hypothetical protein
MWNLALNRYAIPGLELSVDRYRNGVSIII